MNSKSRTSQGFLPKREFLVEVASGHLILKRDSTPVFCPFDTSECLEDESPISCGDWCPHFDLQTEDIKQFIPKQGVVVAPHTTLTLHCSGRRMILDQKGEVTASRNLKGT